jgi:hypothetical protein
MRHFFQGYMLESMTEELVQVIWSDVVGIVAEGRDA